MKRIFIVCATLIFLVFPSAAQDAEGKAALVQGFRSANANLDAEIIDRFISIKASPAFWSVIDSESFNGQYTLSHWFANLAGSISSIATNMEWGDVRALDKNSGYNGKSPVVLSMLDDWKGKIAFSVDLGFEPDPAQVGTVINNLDLTLAPMTSTYYFKPRGGKAFVNIKVDPKATQSSVKVSPDGNTYNVILPAYVSISQSPLEDGLKKGR